MKMTALALLEGNTVIYIDTTNYINNENLSMVIKNYIPDVTLDEKTQRAKELLGRVKVIRIHDAEELILLLAQII